MSPKATEMSNTSLDPEDWGEFRAKAHDLLEACLDRLEQARNLPWQPVPQDIRHSYVLPDKGAASDDLTTALRETVMPYNTGNTHPRFFGWVHGTGMAEGLLAEMVAATMNSNCGGRDHGMVYVERAVIDWTRRQMGFPDTASGVLVTGTSQATVIALSAARLRALGPEVRTTGQGAQRLTAYAGAGIHNAARKAIELLGIGSDNLRRIPQIDGQVDIAALKRRAAQDRADGAIPFALFGTAGSVDFGQFDDLNALADVAAEENLWLHVDGAFGAWTRLADAPWRALSEGIGRADSMACDFHKWMYVPYECGLVLIRNENEHRAAFAARPSYLEAMDTGLAGGDPWFCDYGIDLSRGPRALKVWSAIKAHGAEKLGKAITANCHAAAQMGALVSETQNMQLAAPVVSNLCVFTADASLDPETQSNLNMRIAQDLQNSGQAVFSTTWAQINGHKVTCLRAAITNHRTRPEDVQAAMDAVITERG
ncbi:pyridoxal-dependent decarboxylase [Alisedimentitalea sp. MJ-SS2]|uniref:pyridoxal phosphate-dependent decarboxylase family protein n=1 Tax=Aliisedimentitalea sp. MJ-SS2 TaxID=3049795 RepID=UPI0029098609|nr:pyridoxal-dependent decarboxylase [Alisedimentitalea sp. MJ-SS2]MDU8927370.1 pyridoxal-dependent decarboxylase [Alisedimentitalea sp. MJ-SS2]